MRRALIGLALGALVSGCVKRRNTLPRTASEVPVTAAWVVDMEAAKPPTGTPSDLVSAGTATLAKRNLAHMPLPATEWAGDFDRRRASSWRMSWLDERAGDDGVLLLVELRPYFDNTSVGRYRWIVGVDVIGAPATKPERTVDDRFEVPVFLQFTYQGAEEAIEAAEPEIMRRLGFVIDSVLQDPDGDWSLEGDDGGSMAEPPPAPEPVPAVETASTTGVQGPIYFVMLDRFEDGDPSNNEPGHAPKDPQGYHGGDLQGLIGRLDHLVDLGVKTVWVSPLTQAQWTKAGATGGFHGYWMQDPFAVDVHWGTEDDVRTLRRELTARGMSLVLDVVTNHTGYDSTLREDNPDWFHHNGPVQDWHDPVQAETYDVHGLPDLAQENPEVRDWLLAAADHWLALAEPDGFRMDAVRHVPLSFWQQYNRAVLDKAGEDFLLLGELFDGRPTAVAETWRGGAFRQMFDFPLHYAMVDVFCRDEAPAKLAAMVELDRVYPDPNGLVTFLDNHDLPRIRTVCGGDATRLTNAWTFLYGTRGMPSLTYGTEAELEGAEEPDNRADMRFKDTVTAQLLRKLAKVRTATPGLRGAKTRVVEARDDLLAMMRVAEDGLALVAWNRGKEPAWVQLPLDVPPIRNARDAMTGEQLSLRMRQDRRAPRIEVAPGIVRLIELEAASPGNIADWAGGRPSETRVTFEVTGFDGDTLGVVGGAPELGAWDPAASRKLVRDGDAWRGEATVPAGTVLEYKLVATDDGATVWEDRPNRYIHVQDGGPVQLAWGEG
jgi:glycosidase